jgi:hypothetical protein
MPNLDNTGIFADKKAFTADQIPDLTGKVPNRLRGSLGAL